jgi:N-acetylmuramoyl-L-alanine amidase
MKICIDPGHGGNDSGAVGPSGLEEANTVLIIARQLSAFLLGYKGVFVKLTRTADVFIELGTRCEIANKWGAHYFVSVHLNSFSTDASGIETLYASEKGKLLAAPVQEAMVAATGDVDRGLKYRDDLYVLNGTNMPAILTEGGFISHPPTEEKLKTDDYRTLLADAMALGIAGYLNLSLKRVRT